MACAKSDLKFIKKQVSKICRLMQIKETPVYNSDVFLANIIFANLTEFTNLTEFMKFDEKLKNDKLRVW